jgi:hypothetical protein
MLNRGIICWLTAATLLLTACGSQPPRPAAGDEPARLTAEQLNARVKSLVDQARESNTPERENLLLQAAALLVEQDDNDWARNLLTAIDSSRLDDRAYITHTDLLSTVALADGSYFLAQRILTNPRLEQQWQSMDLPVEIGLRQKRARVFAALGDTDTSVAERVRLSALLTDESAEADNREAIWRSLMAMPQADLQQLSKTESDQVLRGWYSLAALSRNHQANLERQQAQIDAWLAEWPGHPASVQLPNDLRLLRELIDNQPRQIALLLPQQGRLARAAEAVRDGFFAAYYQAIEEQSQIPQIRQYDSSEGDIVALYGQAVAEGADLIIGPLDKDKVNELSLMPSLAVPVLSLNYIDIELNELPRGLYQFGLAAEDEARQAARQSWLEGHRQAMILIPDASWSERSAQAFTDEWLSLGGAVVSNSQFPASGDYSRVLKNALLVQESENRLQELQRLFGARLEFEPRRRHDLDMIFLIANPGQARQIKPTLAFHYAGDVPVYSTSHIYSGVADSASDRDLNGIRFNTMPWLFDNASPEKKAIDKHAQSAAVYSRLHALGVDAYRLYPRLPQLAQVSQARIYGATGALRLLPDGRIEREQVWVQFRGGIARPLPTLVASDSLEN